RRWTSRRTSVAWTSRLISTRENTAQRSWAATSRTSTSRRTRTIEASRAVCDWPNYGGIRPHEVHFSMPANAGHFRPVTDWPYEKGRPSAGGLDEESSNGSGSALRELEALAGARLTGLLALLLARVALEVAGLLEGGTQLRVHLLEGAR